MVVVQKAGFRGELGLFDVVTLIMGSMIGSGIFILPAVMAADVGSAPLVIAAWILGAFLTICGALTFAELSTAFPRTGGQYVFLRESMGKSWSFLYAWTMFLGIQTGIIAAVAVAFATYTDFFVELPGVATPLWGLVLPKWGLSFTAIAVVWLLTFANYYGVKRGAAIQNVSTVMKVAALVMIVVAALALGSGAGNFSNMGTAFGTASLGAFGIALSRSLFAYDGWPQATYVMGEVKDARRVVPQALVLGVGGVAAVYILATIAYFYVLPVGDVVGGVDAQDAGGPQYRIASEAVQTILGSVGAGLVAAAVVVSTFGTVNGYVLTSPRIFHAVAEDGEFPRAFAKLSPHRTPTYGLWYQGVWASLLTLTGTYAELASLVVMGIWFFYIPTAIGYFRLKRRDKDLFKGFRAPLSPAPAVVFILAAVGITLNFLVNDVRTTLILAGILVTGIVVRITMVRKGARA